MFLIDFVVISNNFSNIYTEAIFRSWLYILLLM